MHELSENCRAGNNDLGALGPDALNGSALRLGLLGKFFRDASGSVHADGGDAILASVAGAGGSGECSGGAGGSKHQLHTFTANFVFYATQFLGDEFAHACEF